MIVIFNTHTQEGDTMQIAPLHYKNGHVFTELEGSFWLMDTGSPASFGEVDHVSVDGCTFKVAGNWMGLTVAPISRDICVPCAGLIGMDIIRKFDHLIGFDGGTLAVSGDNLGHAGQRVPLTGYLGVPILKAVIAGKEFPLFFDTGAHISYLQDIALKEFPVTGSYNDFFPGYGRFDTDTCLVDVVIEGSAYNLLFGTLPDTIGAALRMAGTYGVIGNALLLGRVCGYFPRRNELWI
jgi:hypothetical protein